VALFLHPGIAESPSGNNIANTARQISGVSMGAVTLTEAQSSDGQYTRLSLGTGARANIIYMAAPEGNELAPFLDILAWFGGAAEAPLSHDPSMEERIPDGSDILVFTAQGCPHCPSAVSSLSALAVAYPRITLTVADAFHAPDLASRYRVRATPTVVINGGATIVGEIKGADALRFLTGSQESMAQTLSSMIQTGRAEDAAELICEKKCPEAVLEVFSAPEFSTRVGALVAMEEALDRDPRSLDAIVEKLIELLRSPDPALRGDTAGVLGKIGDPRAIPALRVLCDDSHEDVADAAREALELIANQDGA
jgi:alkyl hydroperoxide reductase subunit AhpF